MPTNLFNLQERRDNTRLNPGAQRLFDRLGQGPIPGGAGAPQQRISHLAPTRSPQEVTDLERAYNQQLAEGQASRDLFIARGRETGAENRLAGDIDEANIERGGQSRGLGDIVQEYINQIGGGLSANFDAALGDIDMLGESAATDIRRDFEQRTARSLQDLTSRGLGNTSLLANVGQGAAQGQAREMTRLGESLAGLRLNARSQMGQSQFTSLLPLIELLMGTLSGGLGFPGGTELSGGGGGGLVGNFVPGVPDSMVSMAPGFGFGPGSNQTPAAAPGLPPGARPSGIPSVLGRI